MRLVKVAAIVGAVLLACGSAGWAPAPYPDRMVRIVVPFTAGSITDGVARIIAEKLAGLWSQQVIVENRPGVTGTASVANAAPDGYTLMLTSNGHVISKLFNKDVPFDPVTSFSGVVKLAAITYLAVVPLESPVKSMTDFIALAKKATDATEYFHIPTGRVVEIGTQVMI